MIDRIRRYARALFYGSEITLSVRHGNTSTATASGRTWGEAEFNLRFKVNERGLIADWRTLRKDPDDYRRPVAFRCGCGHACIVKSWVVHDFGSYRNVDGCACDTHGCEFNPSEKVFC